MKLKFLVILYGLPHHIPQGFAGRSGKQYGHAVYDDRYKGHVIRVDGALWMNGAGKDICAGLIRRHRSSLIIAEIVPDPAVPETQAAEELDKMTNLLALVTKDRDGLRADNAALLDHIAKLENVQPVEETSPESEAVNPEPEAVNELEPKTDTVADLPPPAALPSVAEMGYHELRRIAKAINDRRPNAVILQPAPKLPELLAAVLAAPELNDILSEQAA